MVTATQALYDFASADHRLPDPIRADTKRLLADALAIGAAGSTAYGAEAVLKTAKSWGIGGEARIFGRADHLPATNAAYVNSFQIHCLEWDAVHEAAVVHATTAVIAAVSAAIDRRGGCDPETALTAIAVGTDIAAGLGLAAQTSLSFFRPAITGVYGAAAAVARIEGLPASQYPDVFGLAHSQAAGTMQAHHEGSIALALQMAQAARSAVQAVDMVKHGLTGPHDPFEGPFGHFALFDKGALGDYTRDLGKVWRIGEVSIKPYPSGRASHAALGTLAEVRQSGRIIEQIILRVPPLINTLVGRAMHADMTPAYARLCLPFLSALMIRDGRIDPRRFTHETYTDPVIAQLAAKVTIEIDDNQDPNALSPQAVIIRYAHGKEVCIDVPHILGSPNAPLSAAGSQAKRDLCEVLSRVPDPRVFNDPLNWLTDPQ
jgi:2-methylcitrate dehydratase PrpD